jgi:NAD(P)-dependent dehydrogenase (short-subunit alcohol dehydrogenase family)
VTKAGADVCLVDISAEGLDATAQEARSLGVRTVTCEFDLAEPQNCLAAVSTAANTFGRLDALCNVAAVFIPCHAAEMTAADWNRTLAVNLSAPFHLIQAAIPYLLQNNGAVVNVTHAARGYHGANISIDNGITAG